jgi:hypothetical protein
MRLIPVFVILLAASAGASPNIEGHWEGTITPWPATDDIIDSNPLSGSMYSTAYAVFGDYWVADDLLVTFTATVETVTYWSLTTGTLPISMLVYFLDDGAPGPGVVLWSEMISGGDLIFNNTGISFAGYPIYLTIMILPNTDYFAVSPGVTYWTGFHRDDGVNLYVILDTEVNGSECYRDIGSGWVPGSSTGYDPTDLFRIIEGTIALDRTTWGMVKTLLQ